MTFLAKPRLAPPPPTIDGAVWIPLTQGRFALIDEADAEVVLRHTWCFDGMYPVSVIRGRKMRLHVFLLGRGAPSIDHADGNKLDNRRHNIRLATVRQNMANMKRPVTNTSGFKGVIWIEKCKHWRAQIKLNDTHRALGHFTDLIEAACAYNKAAMEKSGLFARLNRMD